MKYLKFSFIPIIGLIFIFTLDAQNRSERIGERGPGREKPNIHRFHDILGLTEEQKESLTELGIKHRNNTDSLRESIRDITVEIRSKMRTDNPDMTKIKELIKEQAEHRTKLQYSRLEHWNGIKEILTSEQYEKWKEHRQNFEQRKDRRGEKGRPERMGRQ